MPTYRYRCRKCGHEYELEHSIKDEKPKRCPRCRGRAVRVPAGGGGVIFKGTGFYSTDYRSKAYKDKAKQEKGGGESAKPPKDKPPDKPPAKPSTGGSG